MEGTDHLPNMKTVHLTNMEGTDHLPNMEGTDHLPNMEGTVHLPNMEGTVPLPNMEGTVPLPNMEGPVHLYMEGTVHLYMEGTVHLPNMEAWAASCVPQAAHSNSPGTCAQHLPALEQVTKEYSGRFTKGFCFTTFSNHQHKDTQDTLFNNKFCNWIC